MNIGKEDGQVFPLSHAQLRLWFLEQQRPASSAYEVFFGVLIQGALEVEALGAALNACVRRHEALRTVFVERDGQVFQRVLRHSAVPLPMVQDELGQGPRAVLARWMEEERRAPLALLGQPLLRVALVRLDEHQHVLLFHMHHLVIDGLSAALLVQDLAHLYAAATSRGDAPAPLAMQYRDFVQKERDWLASTSADAARAYWKAQLSGLPALELATDSPPSAERSSRGDLVALAIPPDVLEALDRIRAPEGCSRFVVLLSAWMVLLHRYSGGADFGVFSFTTNRVEPASRALVGYCAGTVMLRCAFPPHATFRALMRQQKQHVREAIEHQQLPYDKVVKLSESGGVAGQSPRLQAAFVFQPVQEEVISAAGAAWSMVRLTPDGANPATAKFDLTMSLQTTSAGVSGMLSYSTDLYERATIERMLAHFQRLLRSIAEAPDAPLSELSLLPESERVEILRAGNDAATGAPPEHGAHPARTVVELLRRRAEQSPGLGYTFLVDGERQEAFLSFQALDQQARAVAATLQARVAPGERALLLFPTGLEFLPAFFGCLYAGVLAIPAPMPSPSRLSRTLPRLIGILGDAAPVVVLTDRAGAEILDQLAQEAPALVRIERLVVEDCLARPASDWREPALDGACPAYLQYTSGSTSAPRGTLIDHDNLLGCSQLIQEGKRYTKDSVSVMWVPAFHDDGLVQGLVQPIFTGHACVLLAPEHFIARPERWLEAISRYRGTHAGGPNFTYELALRKVPDAALPALDLSSWRVAYNAAEPIRWETLVGFYERFKGSGFQWTTHTPCYGLAEATLLVSAKSYGKGPSRLAVDGRALEREGKVLEVDPAAPGARLLVGCGQMVRSTWLALVRPGTDAPCAPGEIGEVLLQGPGVARGYFGRPEDTERTFGARLDSGEGPFLRTGDLGFLHDGELYITGRCKDLIIIRGENRYPQDIEWTVEACNPAIRPGGVAAFAIEVDGEERLVIAAEARTSGEPSGAEALFGDVRKAISERHELQVGAIALLEPGSIPKTSSGKIQRRACRAGYLDRNLKEHARWTLPSPAPRAQKEDEGAAAASGEGAARRAQEIEAWLAAYFVRHLGISASEVRPDQPFFRYGFDSASGVAMMAALGAWLDRPLEPILAWEHPTVRALAAHLAGAPNAARSARGAGSLRQEGAAGIAIIGMGCRFPGGATSPEAFWRLLEQGEHAIGEVPPDRFRIDDVYDPAPDAPGRTYTRHGGFLRDLEAFDAAFFGVSPREAQSLDPQQRLLLEVAWEALEDAGIVPTHLQGSATGIYVGLSSSDYASRLLPPHDRARIDAYALTGTRPSVAAGRLSYLLGLEGPNMAVDTACSSSLVAIHLACQSLRAGESDLALAGGVNVILGPENTIALSRMRALSPTGRCSAFDASADGYVRSEGCGIVVLKRLADAERDGDRVLAVLRGTAVNQDGRSNGLTAPNGLAQEAVIRRALEAADLSPDRVGLFEAHGTGTPLGDPIEMSALGRVLGSGRPAEAPLYVGSVKSNIGHAETAAGVAGLIKAVLALRARTIPPSLHFTRPNPRIAWSELPVKVPTAPIPWPAAGLPRVAGVNSFGVSGTNAHVLVEEAPERPATVAATSRPLEVFTLSAPEEGALRDLAARYEAHLAAHPEQPLGDVCHTAAIGRSHFDERLAIVTGSTAELLDKLAAFRCGELPARSARGAAARGRPKVAFLFAGQGAQYVNMGKALFESQPVFRSALERAAAALDPHLESPLLESLFPAEGARSRIDETDVTQPALFAMGWALAELWRSWGIAPDVVLGHSIGEYVAACQAGVFSLEDGARLVAARGRLMQALPERGLMVAVETPREAVEALLIEVRDRVSIAAENAPEQVVISGGEAEVSACARRLEAQGVRTRKLAVSHAFHSPLMRPMLQAFRAVAETVTIRPPARTVVSALTGAVAGPEIATVDYWVRHVEQPVLFQRALGVLAEMGVDCFVEVGAHATLLPLGQRCLPASEAAWLPSLRRERDDWETLLVTVAELHARGAAVDWKSFDAPYAPRRVALPTYPFQRKRYWVEERTPTRMPRLAEGVHPILGARLPFAGAERIYQSELSPSAPAYLADHLVFDHVFLVGTALLELCRAAANAHFRGGAHSVEALVLERPLRLSGDAVHHVQTILRPRDAREAELAVHARPIDAAEDAPFTRHATARVVREGGVDLAAPADLAEVRRRCVTPVSVAALRAHKESRGIHYGPSFLGLCEAWAGDGEALGRLQLPEGLAGDAGRYGVHPALLDAALQAIGCLTRAPAAGGVFLPFAVEQFVQRGAAGPEVWVHLRSQGQSGSDGDVVAADLTLYTPEGERIAELSGVQLRRATRDAFADVTTNGRPGMLLSLAWREAALRGNESAPRDCLLVGNEGALARALRGQLEERGARVHAAGASLDVALAVELAAGDGALSVCVLSGVSEEPHATDPAAVEARSRRAIELLQRLARTAEKRTLRVLWVSRGGHATSMEQSSLSLSAAAETGLLRVAATEHPELHLRRIDLAPGEALAQDVAHLVDELSSDEATPEVAWRLGRRFRPVLEPASEPSVRALSALDPEAAYLITGGLGGLGLLAAHHLAERGARHLWLLGRRAPSEQAQSVLAALAQQGCEVRVAEVDVADRQALAAVLCQVWHDRPLRGIIHAAGVLHDATLREQTPARLAKVLGPKVSGALFLHELTQDQPLDFFVLYSSMAPLIGSAGQASYAAANAFLDALAVERRKQGLPGVSIAWGPWTGVGMVEGLAEAHRRKMLARGFVPLEPAAGMSLFDRTLAANLAHVAAANLDLARLREAGDAPLLLEELVEARVAHAPAPAASPTILGRLAALPANERAAALQQFVQEEAAQVLGLAHGAEIDPHRPLHERGLDSLMAVDLRNRLSRTLGRPLPASFALEHRTVAAQSAHLLAQLDLAAPEAPARAPVAMPAEVSLLPASRGQARLWFLEQRAPGAPVYQIHFALELEGPLDAGALETALGDLFARHEALRTVFVETDGQIQQRVLPAGSYALQRLDVAEGTAIERAFTEHVERSIREPFDLTRGPLLRAHLLRCDATHNLLAFGAHHSILDAWSIGVMVRDLAALYRARVAPGARPPSPLPLHPADLVRWEAAWLSSREADEGRAYWAARLSGLPALQLPADHPAPKERTIRGGSVPVVLPKAVVDGLDKLASAEGCTRYVALLAAWAILLHRYTGQTDFGIGTVVANRPLVEHEDLVGYFVNTLVLRCDLAGGVHFRALLGRLRGVVQAAFAHERLPYDEVVRRAGATRDGGLDPLIQAAFVYENLLRHDFSVPGMRWTPAVLTPDASVPGTAKFDLTLTLSPGDEGLRGVLSFSADLFEGSRIELMAAHLVRLCESIVAEPERRIATLDLLAAHERRDLLGAPSAAAQAPPMATIHALFEAQVAAHPEAVAVVFEGESLTYAALEARANEVAHHLRALGVVPEARVGVLLERSLDLVVALLAVLKAGGGYVPLDPAHPERRLHSVIADAEVAVVLTHGKHAARLPAEVRPVLLDEPLPAPARRDAPQSGATAASLAYVIYTSGSTGRPKGVMVTHQNVTRLFSATQAWFHFDATDVWTLFHASTFDFSVWEMWGALLHGGRLVVVSQDDTRNPDTFHALLRRERVTVLNQTPSAFRQLIHADAASASSEPLALRSVIFGGEALDPTMLRPWFERHGDARPVLVNMYGITETTVHVTYRPLTAADAERPASLIGQPIPDLQLHILDANQELSPIGVPGELYVGGAGVSRGYLNRPELTEERFISRGRIRALAGATGRSDGDRLYRTGDLARRLPNGDVEYLGRIDNQVKIRGFRIELGEIEATLSAHPGVREAAVVGQEGADGHRYLAAYVVPSSGAPGVAELRAYLQARLPEYMVPASFTILDVLPLNENGKLDRKELARRGQPALRLVSKNQFVPPETPQEALLAEIWAHVLGARQVGIHDNFFELGGDSILSIRVLARAREAGLDLSMQQLFTHQTIHAILRANRGDAHAAPHAAPFSLCTPEDRSRLPADVEDAYPLAALQLGMLFHSSMDDGSGVYHDLFSYHLRAPFDRDALAQALQDVIARHPILRTGFVLTGYSQPLQLVHRAAPAHLEVEDLSSLSPAEQEGAIERWFAAEKRRGFDTTIAPLLRVQAQIRGANAWNLSVSFHHAILDGWSNALLLTELLQGYVARRGPSSAALPPAPARYYRDFVALERETVQRAEDRQFWQQRLADMAFLKLPRWPSAAKGPDGTSGITTTKVPAEVREGLERLALSAGVPIKSALLAAHLRVLSAIANQEDSQTGLVANGRLEEEGGERVIGLFLNTVPFRLQITDVSWKALARRAFEAECEILPHRRFPLSEIQTLAGGERVFETGFNFVHFHALQAIAGIEGIDLVDVKVFERHNYTLGVIFSIDALTGDLTVNLVHDTAALPNAQVERIAQYYQATLAAMAQEPEASCLAFSPLSEVERAELLGRFSRGGEAAPADRLAHELFEAQAARTPDATALVGPAGEGALVALTYRQLNERANQLARHLRSHGVGRGALVGVHMPRSIELVVSFLAILKAGGAYLPLDPTYPQERREYMIEDARPRVVLTSSIPCERVQGKGALILPLEKEAERIAQQSRDALDRATGPEDLAYVIYTSGTTGRPRGVLVPHRGLPNLANAQIRAFGVTPESRVLQFASPNFDASISELLMALCSGAALHLPRPEALLSSEGLLEALRSGAITHVTLPPSLLAVLPETELPALATIIVAGEPCPPALAARWGRGRRFFNAYGPTETTVCATIAEITAADTQAPLLHIGMPMAGAETYLLDSRLAPVPVATTGEICIGGVGVVLGYLNQPELTADKFVKNPFGAGLLYRSGDLGRFRPDGRIEILGRRDEQLKLRGFRVEPEEIRAVINEHPEVQDSAVVVREAPGVGKQLVTYFSRKPAAAPASEFWPSTFEFPILDELLYHAMTADDRRMAQYKAAIEKVVRGRVVLEVGTGPQAPLAVLCAQAGARKVYSIELLPEVHRAAREHLDKLDLGGVVELFCGDARTIELPERADVCVSALFGSIGGNEGAAVILNGARRLLHPEGVMLPQRTTTRMVAVSLPEELRAAPRFSELGRHYVQKIFAHVGRPFDLRLCIDKLPPDSRISTMDVFEDLDFSRPVPENEEHTITLQIEKAGRFDGFLLGVRVMFTPGVTLDILEGAGSHLPVFLPIFDHGLEVAPGDVIRATCTRMVSADGLHPDFMLHGKLVRRDGSEVPFSHASLQAESRYKATPFYRRLFEREELRAQGQSAMPGQTEEPSRDLRAFLRRKLPEYMLPAHFVELAELPRTPSGKIDRRALPDPTARADAPQGAAPQSELEREIAAIWREVLRIPQVGVNDNFFDLGGHSLLLMIVLNKLQEGRSEVLEIVELFEHPTISSLANHLRGRNIGPSQGGPHTAEAEAPPAAAASAEEIKRKRLAAREQRRQARQGGRS